MSPPHLLTAAEVADVLRTSPKATYAMIARGQLPGVVRIGRRVLVWEDELVDWLDQKACAIAGGVDSDERHNQTFQDWRMGSGYPRESFRTAREHEAGLGSARRSPQHSAGGLPASVNGSWMAAPHLRRRCQNPRRLCQHSKVSLSGFWMATLVRTARSPAALPPKR